MTSACLFDMIIDDKVNSQTIVPNIKRMKISNAFSDVFDKSSININLKKEDDLKRIFPFLNHELIDDILKKTSHNIEKASLMVHSLNKEEFSKNTNFVSIHQSNKKRKFRDLDDSTMSLSHSTSIPIYQPSVKASTIQIPNFNNINNYNQINLPLVNNKKQFNLETETDIILGYAKGSNNLIDLKTFIKQKILSYLSYEDKIKINDTKLKLEKYISDNKYLKQALISIYSKYEETQKQLKEKELLLSQIEELKNEIEIEKLKGNHLHNRILLNDTSSKLNIEGPRDIY